MDQPIIEVTESDWRRLELHLRRDPASGCLLFTGGLDNDGYGHIRINGRGQLVHRVAFVWGGGTLSTSKPHVCHSCDTPACCEFSHLWAGSHHENQVDKARKWRGRGNFTGLPFGVTKIGQRYRATACADRRIYHLGTYVTPEEASAVAVEKRRLLRGW